MADTITVLDPIQFAKADGYHVWTLDGAGPANEAVKTWAISIPVSASGARVIFNSADSTGSAKWHVRVKATKLTELTSGAAPDKTENTQALEWTAVTAPAVVETGAIDLSACYDAVLHIDAALSSTTAVTAGMEIIVQIRSEASLDEWTDLCRFMSHVGTGVVSHFDDTACTNAAGQTVLGVTDPATGKLDHVGKFIFLEDTATIAQCEIAFLVSQSGDS
jgi:hypothetical protein